MRPLGELVHTFCIQGAATAHWHEPKQFTPYTIVRCVCIYLCISTRHFYAAGCVWSVHSSNRARNVGG